MRIITGTSVFFESSAGIMHCTEPVARLPKPPPVYSVMRTTSFGSRRIQRAMEATVWTALCVPGVHVELAVLPPGERRARLEHVMLVVRHRERLVEHQRRVLEASFDVAVRPLDLRLAHRQLALVVLGEVLSGPLHLLDVERAGRLAGLRRRAAPCVALDARVRAVGPQRLDRIDDERERSRTRCG